MNRHHVIAIMGLAFMLGAGSALADDFEFEGTLSVIIGEAEVATPDVIVNGISLPAEAVDNTEDSANLDHNLVNEALTRRQAALDDAAAEVADHFTEAAQDNAENSSRAEDARPDAPGDIPVPPGG